MQLQWTAPVELQVKRLLDKIDAEKHQPKPNKKQMRKWFNEIVQLKEDWRTTYTGQDNKFQLHTSMRTWKDE